MFLKQWWFCLPEDICNIWEHFYVSQLGEWVLTVWSHGWRPGMRLNIVCTAHLHKKNYLVQNVSTAEVEKTLLNSNDSAFWNLSLRNNANTENNFTYAQRYWSINLNFFYKVFSFRRRYSQFGIFVMCIFLYIIVYNNEIWETNLIFWDLGRDLIGHVRLHQFQEHQRIGN